MTNRRKPNPLEHGETSANASKPSATPASQLEMIVYPIEPERASDGIDQAIELLKSMTEISWKTRRDVALVHLQRARVLVDRSLLLSSE